MNSATEKTNTPKFGTADDASVKIFEGKFKDTVYRYKDVSIQEGGILNYNADITEIFVDGEDKTTTLSEFEEAAFLNTVATPILTAVIEDLAKLKPDSPAE